MTSHDAELSRNMDRITQLQDGIDNLVTIMYSTLSFLSRKADFKQLNPDIPITQAIPCPEGAQPPRESFNQNCEELAQDFLRKAKQIEYLISILPPHNHHQSQSTNNKNPPTSHTNQPSSQSIQPTQIPKSSSTITSPKPSLNLNPTKLETEGKEPKTKLADANEPVETNEEDDKDSLEFEQLQADVNAAQAEYDQALLDAESLHVEIKVALRQILDHRVKLVSQLT